MTTNSLRLRSLLSRSIVNFLIFCVILATLIVSQNAFDWLGALQGDVYLIRPWAWGAVVVLLAFLVWASLRAARRLTHCPQISLAASLRALGWLAPVTSAALLVVGLLISAVPPEQGLLTGLKPETVIVVVLPFVVGFQGAFLFSPADEPMLELLLTYPRSIMWLVLERISVLLVIQSGIALVASFAAVVIDRNTDLLALHARWSPPALLLLAVGLFTTVFTREAAFGAAAVALLYGATAIFGESLLGAAPFLYPLHPFLPTGYFDSYDTLLNRLFITSLGITLVTVVLHRVTNEEYILTGIIPIAKNQIGLE